MNSNHSIDVEAERQAHDDWYLDPNRTDGTFGYQDTREGIHAAFRLISEKGWLAAKRSVPAVAGTIDTPGFRQLLRDFVSETINEPGTSEADDMAAIIAHIDARLNDRRTPVSGEVAEETNEHWIAITASGYMCAFGNSGLAYAWAGPRGEVRHIPHRALPALVEPAPAEQSAPPVPLADAWKILQALENPHKDTANAHLWDQAIIEAMHAIDPRRQQVSASPVPRAQGGITNEYDDPKLACSDCGLTMGESRLLGHIKLGIVAIQPVSTAPDSQGIDHAKPEGAPAQVIFMNGHGYELCGFDRVLSSEQVETIFKGALPESIPGWLYSVPHSEYVPVLAQQAGGAEVPANTNKEKSDD